MMMVIFYPHSLQFLLKKPDTFSGRGPRASWATACAAPLGLGVAIMAGEESKRLPFLNDLVSRIWDLYTLSWDIWSKISHSNLIESVFLWTNLIERVWKSLWNWEVEHQYSGDHFMIVADFYYTYLQGKSARKKRQKGRCPVMPGPRFSWPAATMSWG